MTTFTATADPTTGTISVAIEQTTIRDLFTRVVANGWGSATTGQAWTVSGGPVGDYSVTGTRGRHSMSALSSTRSSDIAFGNTDFDITVELRPSVVATGGEIMMVPSGRFLDSNNYLRFDVEFQPAGAIRMRLRKVIAGAFTNFDYVTAGFTYGAGDPIMARFQGTCNDMRGKLWHGTTAEPTSWTNIETQGAIGSAAGTRIAMRSFLNGTVTNPLPVVLEYDNLSVSYGEDLHLYRVATDGIEVEVFGSPFNTLRADASADMATAVLWDSSAPFDVDVFYRLRSSCGTLLMTSNTVNLSSSETGWLRDPVDPTRNFQILLDASYDECIEQDVVVFSGLGNPLYANSSGIFDIIDSARPNTVSMTRKNYASSVALTSFSLDDTLTLEDIFAPGRILLLSLPTTYGWALRSFGTDYITCGDTQQSYIGNDQRVTARAWAVPFKLSGPPADPGPGGVGGNGVGGGDATYDALAASAIGVDYNTLTAAGFTYFQIAAGTGY